MIPIGRFFDHGNAIEKENQQWLDSYVAASAGKRTIVKPGDEIPVKGLRVLVVSSDQKLLAKPVNGGGPNPLCARLATEMIALRQPASCRDGLHGFFQRATLFWSGIFLALAACLGVLLAMVPTPEFLMLSTVATASLIAAGTGASALWFRSSLRRLDLKLRFAPAA